MKHPQTIGLFVAILFLCIGIIYFQYRFYRTSVAPGHTSLPFDQIVSGGPMMNDIPAIKEPKYESVGAADQYLDDNGSGLVVERAGRYRFYPFQILVWHMIVNETFGGDPLLVTYDPLSETANVFERMLVGEIGTFAVSGKLYNSNLLMHETISDSLWSQALGRPIVEEKTDVKLVLVPSLTTTWKQFKSSYPGGQVLSRETGTVRDYTQNPYAKYQSSHAVWFPVTHHDDRLDVKTIVFGFDAGFVQKAYPKEVVREKGMIEDEVGGKRIVVYWDPDLETVRGSTSIDEEEIIMQPSYWFSWVTMHPQASLFLTP